MSYKKGDIPMFNIELIRKMFIYENTTNKKFEMKDFKQLLNLDSNLISQKRFKEWIDNNNLTEVLKTWLKEHDLDKTFSEVYVVGKTSVEEFVDFLFDYGKDLPQETGGKILSNFLDKEKKKNQEIFK
jgi:hypothetical protein